MFHSRFHAFEFFIHVCCHSLWAGGQGGRGHQSGQMTNIANGTLHGEGNCTTAATFCCDSGTTIEREDDPGVDTDLQRPMGEQKILLI